MCKAFFLSLMGSLAFPPLASITHQFFPLAGHLHGNPISCTRCGKKAFSWSCKAAWRAQLALTPPPAKRSLLKVLLPYEGSITLQKESNYEMSMNEIIKKMKKKVVKENLTCPIKWDPNVYFEDAAGTQIHDGYTNAACHNF